MEDLKNTIDHARKVMQSNNLKFATIWKTNKSIGFNFDCKPIGFEIKENGVNRKVIFIVNG